MKNWLTTVTRAFRLRLERHCQRLTSLYQIRRKMDFFPSIPGITLLIEIAIKKAPVSCALGRSQGLTSLDHALSMSASELRYGPLISWVPSRNSLLGLKCEFEIALLAQVSMSERMHYVISKCRDPGNKKGFNGEAHSLLLHSVE